MNGEKRLGKETVKNILLILIKIICGSFLIAIAINGFYIPQKLLGGGLNGVTMLLNILLGVDTGLAYAVLNVPIFILGFLVLPRRFMAYTIVGLVTFSSALSLTAGFHLTAQNILTPILLGGALYGAGNGMIYSAGASTGGTDIIAKIVNRKFSLNISTVGFLLNLLVISVSMYFFGVDISVMTLAAMFVSTQVSNYVVDGLNHKRMVFIVSDQRNEELATAILDELGRGVTVLKGEGAYTGQEKTMIYTVVGITQVAKLKALVKKIDAKAFVTVTETSQVIGRGKGFYDIYDEI